jgi:transcriptional regulator with XRE-family HTH domain
VSFPPANETIGQRLRRLRKERGLPQRELTGPGVSHAYVSRIEADLRTPSVKAIRKIAAKLGVSPDYLERGRDASTFEERELRLLDCELALYFEGNTAETERTLEEIAVEAAQQGDSAALAGARIALGNLALARGDHEIALGYFEQAMVSEEASPSSRPQLYVDAAGCHSALGAPDRAVALLREALARLESEAREAGLSLAGLELALARTLHEAGKEAEAAELFSRATRELRAENDLPQRVRSLWASARLDSEADRQRAALGKLRKAAAMLEAMEELRLIADSELLLGEGNPDSSR